MCVWSKNPLGDEIFEKNCMYSIRKSQWKIGFHHFLRFSRVPADEFSTFTFSVGAEKFFRLERNSAGLRGKSSPVPCQALDLTLGSRHCRMSASQNKILCAISPPDLTWLASDGKTPSGSWLLREKSYFWQNGHVCIWKWAFWGILIGTSNQCQLVNCGK